MNRLLNLLDPLKEYDYVKFIGHIIECRIDDKDDEFFRLEAYCDVIDRNDRFIRNAIVGLRIKRDRFLGSPEDILEDELIDTDFKMECNPQESTFQPFSIGYKLK